LAQNACAGQLNSYAPGAADDPGIGLLFSPPSPQDWATDRSVVCVAATSEHRAGSLRR
jgi:hypothetical protein